MTTTTLRKPLAPHGTYARYVGRPAASIPGCRCQPCTAQGSAYASRRSLLTATGRALTVPAAPATKHLRMLRAAGAGWNQLVAVTGCSSSTICALLDAKRDEIRRTTAQKILAVRLADVICLKRPVPALGATRRVRALIAAGHRVIDIRDASGVDQTTVSYLIGGKVTGIRAETHLRIDKAFDHLAMTPGTSTASINRGRRHGWALPLAWDNPDDPDETPDSGDTGSRIEAIIEDTAELARYGHGRAAIAQRLGLTWDAVSRAHQRGGVHIPELAA